MLKPISFDIFISDDVDQMLQVKENGIGVDITGAAEISLFLPKPDSAGVPQFFEAKFTTSKIAKEVGTQGLFRLVLAQADSALLKETCEPIDFDVVVTDAASKKRTYRFYSSLRILKRKSS